MRTFLSSGDLGIKAVREIVASVAGKSSPSLVKQYRVRPPITRPDKIICPAVNYHEHGKEGGVAPPSESYFFGKFVNTIIGPDDPVIIPKISTMPDYEVELAAVIGKRGKYIKKENVYDFIAGYTIINDISLRDLQGWPQSNQSYGPHWIMGKNADTACPMGPCIVTRDEIQNPYPLKIKLSVNGVTRQDADTSQQIFKIPDLVSYLSQVMTLEPGDIVSTGTPSGVGRTTNSYLKEGDIIRAEIEKIGVLSNPVKKDSGINF
ncbi:MAG: fumarylacetoacetate hydrolase family protein [Nitrososphaerota archaeon]|nr:fumarylacetoacetate hydrolase family protein [Nitrososphaerota archaeon]MDG6924061.1 fumarylacetoacetate hydrolase family protein [Nitrososphaerota archaeon]